MRSLTAIMTICVMALICGCASQGYKSSRSAGMDFASSADAEGNEAVVERMMVWRASLSIEVNSISNALHTATQFARKSGGYIEQKSGYSQKSGRATLRVPAKNLNQTLGSLETIGFVTSRSVSGEDITEQYVDVEARLKNRIALRDRLQKLLDKATGVKDVLAIEKELNRVQGDIDSMQARMKVLKGRVDFATINLMLSRKKILGPLGYMFKGLFWGVEKLFVIRE